MDFKSTHNLDFEWAPWVTDDFIQFKIGTCEGLWTSDNDSYKILSIVNSQPGNGHIQDVFDWFENSCKRDKRNLIILELWNPAFKAKLINKMGFIDTGDNNLKKTFAA